MALPHSEADTIAESTEDLLRIERHGLVMIFTGPGKGKTTAALGLGLRALGHGMSVMMIQFIKGKWRSGELRALERMGPEFTLVRRGEGFTRRINDDSQLQRHREAAREALGMAREALESGKDVLILDEVCTAISVGLLGADEVMSLLGARPPSLHLVLTGRGAPEALIERADMVTEMREVKHHYRQGVKAQRGIEF